MVCRQGRRRVAQDGKYARSSSIADGLAQGVGDFSGGCPRMLIDADSDFELNGK